MKRLSFLLTLCLLLSLLAGCGQADVPAQTTASPETTAATEPAPSGPSQAAIDALDGKKILFIGNSLTFYGYAVIYDKEETPQHARANNQGLFYHLCKQNGMEVNVTNWTFPGHDFTDMTGSDCTKPDSVCLGVNHWNDLVDRSFDYVAIQCYYETEYTGDMATHLEPVLNQFREANPNVKFLFLVPHMLYTKNMHWIDSWEHIAAEDMIICNWGRMITDIMEKKVTVPGATQQHVGCTYIVGKTKEDGFHENMLVGYLTSLMVYCAITGESAVGQPYEFCDDSSLNPKFDIDAYKAAQYVYDPITNFDVVMRSEADMLGLQQLIDDYLAKYN